MKRPLLIYSTLTLLSVVLTGIVLEPVAAKDETYKYLANFADTLELVQRNYVESVPLNRMVGGAFQGLLEELDAESFYLSPAALAQFREPRRSASIGVDVSKRNGYGVIVSVVPGSPADGLLRTGDYLRVVDGKSTRSLSVFDIERHLSGAAGSEVGLKVVHRDDFETEKLTLKRAKVKVPALIQTEPTEDVISLRLVQIDAAAITAAKKALANRTPPLSGVILDLRGCSRGTIADGAAFADLFLDDGRLVAVSGKTNEATVHRRLQKLGPKAKESLVEADADDYTLEVAARATTTVWRGPLMVLIDPGTAGAAEVLAAAIRDGGRGTVLGTRSFGRGSIQDLIELEDGAALQLTIARVIDADGESLVGRGVEPSERVEEPVTEEANPAMDRALERLKTPAVDEQEKKAA